MTPEDLRPVTTGLLHAEAAVDGARLQVHLDGEAGAAEIEPLDRFLSDLHGAAERLGVDEVEVDLRALEFINSSCLAIIVSWLGRGAGGGPTYRVRLLSDPTRAWQRKSCDVLRAVGGGRVDVVS